MKIQEVKTYINRILGDDVRCLLPSYWWKKLFHLILDEIEKKADKSYLDNEVSLLNKKIDKLPSSGNTSEPMINITYRQLYNLKITNRLIPGKKYRITDYITTACGGNIKSKGLKYDVVVEAITANVLNENATALRTEEGDNLPQNVYPERWKLKYTIDNRYIIHPWAKTQYSNGCIVKVFNNSSNDYDYIPYYYLDEHYHGAITYNAYNYTGQLLEMPVNLLQGDATINDYIAYRISDFADYRLYKIKSITDTAIVYNTGSSNDETALWDETDGCYKIAGYIAKKASLLKSATIGQDVIALHNSYVNNGKIIEITDTTTEEGKGVIYEMEDEYDNKLPYDFKNLMFKRYKVSGSLVVYSGYKASDAYISKPVQVHPNWGSGDVFSVDINDFIFLTTFSLNDIQSLDDRSLTGQVKHCKLGSDCLNNVFIGDLGTGYVSMSYGCKYNTFEVSQNHNFTTGSNVQLNFTKSYTHGNSHIGDSCKNNILYLKDAKIGEQCSNNYFELDSSELGNECNNNYIRLSNSGIGSKIRNCLFNSGGAVVLEDNLSSIRLNGSGQYFAIESENHYINITSTNSKNFCIKSGVNKEYVSDGGGSTISLSIPNDNNYRLLIDRNSQGEIKMWNPADMIS